MIQTAIDAVIEKIKKAVRLARRTTSDGERETALRLARELAERNGLAFEEVAADDATPDRATQAEDTQYTTKYDGPEWGFTCFILYEHFGVEAMLERSPTNDRRRKALWFGSRLNIELAKHVAHILLRESRRGWEAVRASGLVRQVYMQGFFWAVHKRLEESPLRNDAEVAADRAQTDRKVDEFERRMKEKGGEVNRRAPRSRRGRGNGEDADAKALVAGLRAGSAVRLARPCGSREGRRAAAVAGSAPAGLVGDGNGK